MKPLPEMVFPMPQVDLITARGLTWGEDYYGNFGLSFFTMFQVLTGSRLDGKDLF